MIDTQHLIHIQLNNEQKWAKVLGIRNQGKIVKMQTVNGETFITKPEGQDTISGYPTLREAIQRTSPTLVRISQLTEPNRVYGLEEKRQGKRKIGWAQAIYPLQARLQELKNNALSEKWDEVLEDELMELKSGEQAFMATRPELIQAGYTTLDSIPRIQKGSGTRFYCPALKGVDSRTQEKVSNCFVSCFPSHLLVGGSFLRGCFVFSPARLRAFHALSCNHLTSFAKIFCSLWMRSASAWPVGFSSKSP